MAKNELNAIGFCLMACNDAFYECIDVIEWLASREVSADVHIYVHGSQLSMSDAAAASVVFRELAQSCNFSIEVHFETGQERLVQIVQDILSENVPEESIDVSLLSSRLPNLDLVFVPYKEDLSGGLLVYEHGYAEFYAYGDKLTVASVAEALKSFAVTERRQGGISSTAAE